MKVTKRLIEIITAAVFVIISINPAIAGTLNVGPSGYEYSSIQAAIDAAVNGEEVLVYDGIYQENIDFKGKEIMVRSVKGAYFTTIDGNSTDSVITFNHGEGEDSVLDGFIVQNGSAYKGGGISCSNNSSPTIVNCIIQKNKATFGSGMNCDHSSPVFRNCTIGNNTASKQGGGIYCAHESSPKLMNCTFRNNKAPISGGAIACEADSPLIATNCIISDNSTDKGGGIYCYYSSVKITNSVISNNLGLSGGGIYCYNCSSIFTNCTIADNEAVKDGGGIFCEYHASPKLINCILWGDSARGAVNEIFPNETNSITVAYSDIQQDTGVYPGVHNINEDPLFGRSKKENFYLQPDSPCIDMGMSANAPSEDMEGIARPQGGGIDIGAYEYVGPASCIPRALFSATPQTGTDSLTVEFDASSSGGSQYPGATFFWDFGDGSTGNGMKTTHTYPQYGSFDASLTINTECGAHSTKFYDFIKIKSSHVTKEVGVRTSLYLHSGCD